MATVAAEPALREISLSEIKESKSNPRRTFSEKSLKGLEASIAEKGILVPLLVRPVNGHFELVAGARRIRAAKKAGLSKVPVIVRELSDDQALEAQVIENLQREDVHPIEEAEGYEALLGRPGYDVKVLASKVGMSEAYIYRKLKLANLTPAAKKAFYGELIAEGHAELLARLGPDDQARALKACTIEGWQSVEDGEVDLGRFKRPITVRELAAFVSKELQLALSGAPWKKDDAELLPKAGPCSTCPKRSGKEEASLFPDVKAQERCGDRVCYGEKLAAWIKRHEKEAHEAGEQFVAVSTLSGYSYEESLATGLALPADGWLEAKQGCAPVYRGLAVDGKRIGQTFAVCVGSDCKRCKRAKEEAAARSTTDRYGRAKPTEKERAKRKAQLLKERVDAEVARRGVLAIGKKVAGPPKGAPLRHLVEFLWDRLWHDVKKPYCVLKGWSGRKQSYSNAVDYDDAFKKATKDMSDRQFWSLLGELRHSLMLGQSWMADDGAFESELKASGVDLKKLKAQVQEELKPKKAAKSKR